ncbi:MAG: hypothetical protein FJX22_03565 [Alphaproteobacteria bacterium]|nr:hypothetical protein [Alphaproteobacteria bacterium]
MPMFNHVQIKVKDLAISRNFYQNIMDTLGFQVVLDIENEVVGYGNNVHDMFEIRQADTVAPLSSNVHIAFNASCQKDVDNFYNVAIKNGASCNGKREC